MSDFLSAMRTSVSGMAAQSMRLRLSAENIANVDTPGFRGKLVSFHEVVDPGGASLVKPGRVQLSERAPERIHDPSHPLADEAGYYDGSSVNLMVEIADARQAQRSYEANLRMFDQSRAMSSALLDLLRR